MDSLFLAFPLLPLIFSWKSTAVVTLWTLKPVKRKKTLHKYNSSFEKYKLQLMHHQSRIYLLSSSDTWSLIKVLLPKILKLILTGCNFLRNLFSALKIKVLRTKYESGGGEGEVGQLASSEELQPNRDFKYYFNKQNKFIFWRDSKI